MREASDSPGVGVRVPDHQPRMPDWILVGDGAQQTAEFPNFIKTAYGPGFFLRNPRTSAGKLPCPQCVNDTHSLSQSAHQLNKLKTYIMKEGALMALRVPVRCHLPNSAGTG